MPSISVPDGSHGRRVRRTVQAMEAPARVDFPGAAQVIRIRRTRTVNRRGGGRRTTTEVVHPVLSLPPADAQPEQVASWARGHWAIEVRHEVLCFRTGMRGLRGSVVAAAGRS